MAAGIIVFGPMACGKTRNKEAIAKALKLTKIVDDGYPVKTIKDDTLYLTCDRPTVLPYMTFYQAMSLVRNS